MAVGALVERVDLRVADVLLDRVVLQEARAAVGLERLGAEQHPGALGAEALDEREHEVADPVGDLGRRALLERGGRVAGLGLADGVLLARGVEDERAQALGIRLLEHERAADVGVVGDGDARRGLVGHLREVGALDALLGVLERVEVAGRERGDRLGADEHPGVLDDLEHLGDAVVDVAEQGADGRLVLAERHLARRADLEAHLVLDVGDVGAVALAELAGLEVDVELRDDEEATGPWCRGRRPRGGRGRSGRRCRPGRTRPR